MSTANLEYTQLIEQFKNEANAIAVETIKSLEEMVSGLKKTSFLTIDAVGEFEKQIAITLTDAQNKLFKKQKEFYEIIDTSSSDFYTELEEIKKIIEQKKQDALFQLNKSEDSAITRLEETYDTGVATILSAEKTALHNLGLLTNELVGKLRTTADSVDITIKSKLNDSLNEIEKYSNTLKEEIKETEIQIKESIKTEADKLIAEVGKELKNIKNDMQNFVVILKKELTEHKDLMLSEIRQDKEKFFIEIDREQSRILEVFRLKEYEISTNLIKKEQAIIANIAMVVTGYDRELEVLKQSKLNEFIDALKLIVDKTIKDAINNGEELFRAQVDRIIKEIEDAIMDDTVDNVRKLLNEFSEQRHEFVLPAGKTLIELPKGKFTITNRMKLYLDGTLQVREKHYTTDVVNRTITLTRTFPDDIDVILTEDIPNQDVRAQVEAGLEELKHEKNTSLTEIDTSRKESLAEIEKTRSNSLSDIDINRKKTLEEIDKDRTSSIKQIDEDRVLSLNEINKAKELTLAETKKTKEESLEEILQLKINSVQQLEDKLTALIKILEAEMDKTSKSFKQDFKDYVEQWREGSYVTKAKKGQSIVEIPPTMLRLNKNAKVYFDGILQIFNSNYTIDSSENTLIISNPFEYPIDIVILQNLPIASLAISKSEATNREIDALFKIKQTQE